MHEAENAAVYAPCLHVGCLINGGPGIFLVLFRHCQSESMYGHKPLFLNLTRNS
jgi:hypothetical protein